MKKMIVTLIVGLFSTNISQAIGKAIVIRTHPTRVSSIRDVSKFSQSSGLGWSFHIIMRHPDKTENEIANDFLKLLWNDVVKYENISGYAVAWNNWNNFFHQNKPGAITELSFVLGANNEKGEKELKEYLQAHQGLVLYDERVVFRPIKAIAVATKLEFRRARTLLLTSEQWTLFDGDDAITKSDKWVADMADALAIKDKAGFLKALRRHFTKEKVKQASDLWEMAGSIDIDGDIVLMTTAHRSQGHEPELTAYSVTADWEPQKKR